MSQVVAGALKVSKNAAQIGRGSELPVKVPNWLHAPCCTPHATAPITTPLPRVISDLYHVYLRSDTATLLRGTSTPLHAVTTATDTGCNHRDASGTRSVASGYRTLTLLMTLLNM